MDLGSGQSLNDHHRGATVRTVPEITRGMISGGCWFRLRRYRAEGCEAKRQKLSSAPAGEETEVADADKAFGKQMQQETSQELIER